jgi:hypothetical protein
MGQYLYVIRIAFSTSDHQGDLDKEWNVIRGATRNPEHIRSTVGKRTKKPKQRRSEFAARSTFPVSAKVSYALNQVQ